MRKEKLEELNKYINELKTSKKELLDKSSKFLSVERYNCYLNNGEKIIREKLLKANNNGSAVIVCPVTKDGTVILTVQPRVFTKSTVGISFPAGYVEENEDYDVAALRELQEETGYTSNILIELATYYQDDGIGGALNKCYLALDSYKVSDQNLDESEYIKYYECKIDEMLELYEKGYILDGGTQLALEKVKPILQEKYKKKGEINMDNKTLMTDFYELTMAQTYFNEEKMDEEVYFDIFFRKNPFNGGYTISGGIEETIEYIKNFKFDKEEIEYLRSLNTFNEDFLDYLANLKFKGDIYAVEDGTIVFPNEPVLTVKADVITAQLLETALLTNFNYASLITTSAKRLTNEAKGIPVMEFGARRARGMDSAIEASKHAFVGGCVGTSNTYAGMKYDIPVLGTMAHSLVTESEDEYDAFLKYAKSNPYNCLFLVDTYDTLKSGIPNAIRVADEYLTPNKLPFKGIRIDSGDLAYLSKEARKMLDEAGYPEAKICLSNGLTAEAIRSLLKQGAVIDSIGAGDNIAAPNERVGGVYKLVAVEKDGLPDPRIKVSNDTIKTINPGYKKLYRFYDKKTGYALGDVIALADEELPKDYYQLVHPTETWKTKDITNYEIRELQVPIFKNGELVYNLPDLKERREYCQKEFDTLYPEVQRLENPHKYYVDLSDNLRELKDNLIKQHTNKKGKTNIKNREVN